MTGQGRTGGEAGRSLVHAAALLAWLPAAPLAAQDGPPQVTVFAEGLHTGLCVEFLVAADSLRDHLSGEVVPTPVESLAASHPALARVATDEPTYRGWIPAQYCWYLYREAILRGRRIVVDDGAHPVAFGYLAVATTDPSGAPAPAVVTFFTNSGRIAGAIEGARLRVDEIDFTLGLIPTEEESPSRRRYTAKHGKTTIQWDGGPGTPRPSEPRALRLLGRTRGGGLRVIETTITPDSTLAASGSLKVTGEGELQRLMAASPIRLVTSFLWGGDSDWVFGR